MSFCPSKDIHSVYLDNELPEAYKAEYESHVNNCPKCQKELNQLKSLRSLLQMDSQSIAPDSHYLDQSFERLQLKMAYSKNTGKQHKHHSIQWGYVASAAAAAAVFALVLPAKTSNSVNQIITPSAYGANVASVPSAISGNSAATTANNVSFNSGRNVLVSGKIPDTVISSESKRTNDSTLTKNVKDVEVFRPDLEDGSISIRITVPGVGDIPVTTEISVPMDVITGRF